jgi:HEAT repeat protein
MEVSGHLLDVAISGRAQIAATVVRRLNAAVKSRRLYAAGHPLRAQTVSAFLTAIVSFHERYGGLVLETHRDGLILEGRPFEGGESIDSLALELYSIGVWQLVLLPGLTEPELEKLLDVVTMEPDAILQQGGLTGLLVKQGIDRVRVVELRPGEEEPANLTVEMYHRMLEGSLSAQEQAALVSVLRAGPDQAARLLSLVVERTKQAFADSSGAGLGERVYRALTALDRLIVDAPASESADLLKHLAQAVTNIDDPQRHLMHRAILQRAAHDLSARALLSAMTSEQIARMVIPCLEAGEPPPQLAQVINGLPFDPQKARDALALVAQHSGRSFDLPPALEELRLPPWVRDIPQDLTDFVVSDAEVALSDAEVKALAAETHVDDATLLADHTMAMLHLALADDDLPEEEATLAVLAADIAAAASQGNIEIIGTTVQHLQPAARATGRKGDLVRSALRRLLVEAFAPWPAKEIYGWPEDYPLLVNLRKAGRTVGAELAQALAAERDLTRRPAIAALLARVGDSALDAIVPLLSDRNVDVVRTVIPVLVHMRSPSAMAALRTVARHPDARVRKEAVTALGPAPGAEAQTSLVAFLRDPDPQVSETCVRFVRSETARKHSPELIAMLGDRTLGRQPMLRMRLIDLLVQAGAKEAIPAVRKLASPFKLRRMDRTMARYARTAIRLLEQGPARQGAMG